MVDKRKTADGEEATVKRQRVSRACDQCRAFREKCDGLKEPGCFTCLSSNRECTYTTPPKKRGIQPGYIRSLELTLAWLFENCPGAETTLVAAVTQDRISPLLSGKDIEGSTRLYKAWRKSASCKELEKLLGSSKADQSFTPEQDSADDNAQGQPPKSEPSKLPQEDLVLATLPTNLWRILDVYFAYTHSWLPIIEKHDMLRLAYAYGNLGIELRPGEQPEHAELWALLAIAAIQDEVASSIPVTDRTSKQIYETARRLIPDERGKHSISHVKALVLLTLIKIGSGDWTSAWLLLGQAINIAMDLGITTSHDHDHARTRHTVLACLLLEQSLCYHLKRKSRMSIVDTTFLEPVCEDGLEEWQPWIQCEGFAQVPQVEMASASTRRASHTLSIFNQLVQFSNCSSSGFANIPLPDHLQHAQAHITTPQMLQLHVLRSLFIRDLTGAVDLSLSFVQRFGVAAMPPMFRLYLNEMRRSDIAAAHEEIRGTLTDILTSFTGVWEEEVMEMQTTQQTDANSNLLRQHKEVSQASLNELIPANVSEYTTPLLSDPTDMSAYLGGSQSLVGVRNSTIGMQSYGVTSPFTERQRRSSQNPTTGTASDAFERYSANGSIDVDALFDELASLDADGTDRQPMFMQNLGLAPNTDMNDVMTSDFGFDPLLSTYFNSPTMPMRSTDNFG